MKSNDRFVHNIVNPSYGETLRNNQASIKTTEVALEFTKKVHLSNRDLINDFKNTEENENFGPSFVNKIGNLRKSFQNTDQNNKSGYQNISMIEDEK